jgi:uncharacterized protein
VSPLFGKRRRARGPRILFATDVHGSDRCFRKFLNSASFYGVDHLVLGGDITGKLLVPIVRKPDGTYDCRYGDSAYVDLDQAGVEELTLRIRGFGHYVITVDQDELLELEADEHRDGVFREVVRKSVEDWVALAEERLRGTGVRCFMAPGNDDFLSIDPALEGSDIVEFAENRLLRLDDTHEMITTERELPEPQLRERIEGMARGVEAPENLVVVLHPPPYHSGLDDAPQLNDDLEMTLWRAAAARASRPRARREGRGDARPHVVPQPG